MPLLNVAAQSLLTCLPPASHLPHTPAPQPVTESEWQFVLGLEGAAPAGEQLAEEQQRQQRQPKAAKGKKR